MASGASMAPTTASASDKIISFRYGKDAGGAIGGVV
jgi:hypothetical protein